jgi:hypothetical protein
VLGTGAAEVELESFSGEVRIRRAGTLPPSKTKGDAHDSEVSQFGVSFFPDRRGPGGACQPAAISVF